MKNEDLVDSGEAKGRRHLVYFSADDPNFALLESGVVFLSS